MVEGTGLENRHTGEPGIESSNLSLSARQKRVKPRKTTQNDAGAVALEGRRAGFFFPLWTRDVRRRSRERLVLLVPQPKASPSDAGQRGKSARREHECRRLGRTGHRVVVIVQVGHWRFAGRVVAGRVVHRRVRRVISENAR